MSDAKLHFKISALKCYLRSNEGIVVVNLACEVNKWTEDGSCFMDQTKQNELIYYVEKRILII